MIAGYINVHLIIRILIIIIIIYLLQVIFSSTRAARQCAERLHLTSKMGNVMTVFVDNLGE